MTFRKFCHELDVELVQMKYFRQSFRCFFDAVELPQASCLLQSQTYAVRILLGHQAVDHMYGLSIVIALQSIPQRALSPDAHGRSYNDQCYCRYSFHNRLIIRMSCFVIVAYG